MSSENEALVRVDRISKKFCRDLKKSLWYGMRDVASELIPIQNSKSKIQNSEDTLRPGEFWANKDISFELRRGECLGLVGHNGAGKTTLLKMLNGLIKPDFGTIEMRGRVGALIALGAGFNPILTGRENIYVSGSILGLTKDEIDEQIDDIIDFAEIREFIDTPVQSYSSGMQVRLGFSVASSLNPDVLILDEVLAVGDHGFAIKCLNRVRKIAANAAVIFVSHTMQFVSSICTKVLVLENGRTLMLADNPSDGINCYLKMMKREASEFRANETDILGIDFMGHHQQSGATVEIIHGAELDIKLDVIIQSSSDKNRIGIFIEDEARTQIIEYPLENDQGEIIFANGRHTIIIPLGKIDFNTGQYSFMIAIHDLNAKMALLRIAGLYPFIVKGNKNSWAKIMRPIVPQIL